MNKLLIKYSTGKQILVLFIVTSVVYGFMLLFTIPELVAFSGGLKILDMMPLGYDHAYVNNLLAALGENGRHAYLYRQLPLDLLYPFLFGITYSTLLAYVLNKLGKLRSFLFYFCFLPLLAGLFDYVENIGIIAMLNTYPDNSTSLTSTTSIFSVLKSTCTTLYFATLIMALVAWAIRSMKKKV